MMHQYLRTGFTIEELQEKLCPNNEEYKILCISQVDSALIALNLDKEDSTND